MNNRNIQWTDFAPVSSSRQREQIEWSIGYAYNATETDKPRVLLIGDSICKGYESRVRDLLNGKVNVSFWASSKCVTDPDYLRELDFMLDARPYDMITFNNGLHSLFTDREEWNAAYASAVSFIQAKLPDTKLSLVLSTPLTEEKLTKTVVSLNETVRNIAADMNLPVLDLFSPMDALDRDRYWTDTFHYQPEAVDMQAELIASHCLSALLPENAPG